MKNKINIFKTNLIKKCSLGEEGVLWQVDDTPRPKLHVGMETATGGPPQPRHHPQQRRLANTRLPAHQHVVMATHGEV